MRTISKIVNLFSGEYELVFTYNENISGVLNDFIVYDTSELEQGLDNPKDDDLAIYPANINITIDDDTRENFLKFVALKNSYNKNYPFNTESIFELTIKRNGDLFFKGIIEECEQVIMEGDDYNIKLNLVDGINKMKSISLGNPYLLEALYQAGFINRVGYEKAWGYGFARLYDYGVAGIGAQFLQDNSGNFMDPDKNVNLKQLIINLFKSLNPNLDVNFQTELYFQNQTIPFYEVQIDEVFVKRVCSILFGRFLAVKKERYRYIVGVEGPGWEYTMPDKYIKVYEDDVWITWYHNWEGTLFPIVFHKGVNERKLNDFLKYLAKNLFCYFGFESPNKIFWRHKRFSKNPILLNRLKELHIDNTYKKVDSVSVKGIINATEHTEGYYVENDDNENLEINIPFTTLETNNGHESWLYFTRENHEQQIVNVRDPQTEYEPAFIQEIVAKDEFELKKKNRLKVEALVEGVEYMFNDTYKAVHENVDYVFRPISMSKNLKDDLTKIIGLELTQEELNA